MKLLVALWALADTVSALLPVIVPLNDDANGTQWGPVTADISANRCRAFAVDFEGGKKTEMVVTVEDSYKGLNYVAAGIGRYNNKEVAGSPAILSGCTAQYRYRNPFSAGALLAPEAQCWGDLYSRVDTAGYYVDEKTDAAICNRYTLPIKTMGAGADSKAKCGPRGNTSMAWGSPVDFRRSPLKLEVLASGKAVAVARRAQVVDRRGPQVKCGPASRQTRIFSRGSTRGGPTPPADLRVTRATPLADYAGRAAVERDIAVCRGPRAMEKTRSASGRRAHGLREAHAVERGITPAHREFSPDAGPTPVRRQDGE